MKAEIVIILATLIVVINTLIGHFFAPVGILLTPVVVLLLTGLISKNACFSSFSKSLLLYISIGLHDIGVKSFAGGIHDWQGLGWIHMMLLLGIGPSFLMLTYYILKQKNESLEDKLLALILFPGLLFIHLHLFGEFGLERH